MADGGVLVAGRDVDRVGVAGDRSGRDAALGGAMADVLLGDLVQRGVVEQLAPIDGDLGEVDRVHLDRPDGVREVQIAQDDDRGLVLLGQVEGAVAGLEALLDGARAR